MRFHADVVIPYDAQNVEKKVSYLMAPYADMESIPYPRECDCVYRSAIKKLETGQYAINGRVKNSLIEFKKDVFEKAGPELTQKLELLRLGCVDPECEDCQGSGIFTSTHNYMTQWDGWEIEPILTVFKDCLKSGGNFAPDQTSVPVTDLDLDKVPRPRALVTPDGEWHTSDRFIWFSNAVIVDENWEQTFRNLLKSYADARLVIVNCHF